MKRPCGILLALLVATLASAQAPATLGEEQALEQALRFGTALESADAGALRDLLPHRGKIRVHLDLLGPEEGAFGASQVRALFAEVLARIAIREFEIERLDCDPGRYALVQARMRASSGAGEPTDLRLQLTFRPGGDAWRVQEIRETPP